MKLMLAGPPSDKGALHGLHQHLGSGGDAIDGHADGVLDRIDNGGSRTIDGQLANALSACGTMSIWNLFEIHTNGRKVGRSGHDVVRHLVVNHPSLAPGNIFIQSKADSLRDSAFDLPHCEYRIDHAPNFLDGDKVLNDSLPGASVHGYLGDVHRPGVSRICVTLILVVVPMDPRRSCVLAVARQCAV